jgi:hypothetical protein
VNEGYTELPTQGVGDLLGGSFIDNPKGDEYQKINICEPEQVSFLMPPLLVRRCNGPTAGPVYLEVH